MEKLKIFSGLTIYESWKKELETQLSSIIGIHISSVNLRSETLDIANKLASVTNLNLMIDKETPEIAYLVPEGVEKSQLADLFDSVKNINPDLYERIVDESMYVVEVEAYDEIDFNAILIKAFPGNSDNLSLRSKDIIEKINKLEGGYKTMLIDGVIILTKSDELISVLMNHQLNECRRISERENDLDEIHSILRKHICTV